MRTMTEPLPPMVREYLLHFVSETPIDRQSWLEQVGIDRNNWYAEIMKDDDKLLKAVGVSMAMSEPDRIARLDGMLIALNSPLVVGGPGYGLKPRRVGF
jgi:hypothetical protein